MRFKIKRKTLTRCTGVLGATLLAISAGTGIFSNEPVSHAENVSSRTEIPVTVAGSEVDNTKWTAVDKAKTITRTIHFIDESGHTVAKDVVETHTGQIFTTKNGDDTVTKAFTIVNGAATDVQPKFTAVTSPEVKGYKLKNDQFKTIPEQGWSLDGTQNTDPKTGFYTNLAQDEVINVIYVKDSTQNTQLKEAVPVNGYTVLNVKTMTRTINYVDVNGTKLHDPEVETVKYETVASDKLTPAEQQSYKNQKVAVVKVVKDANGNITSQSASIVETPAYKLKDVTPPEINGYKLQNKKFKSLSGQYMWLSPASHVQATLDNGLPQYIYQDELIDVIYEPKTDADKQKEEESKKKQDTKDKQKKDAKKKKNGSTIVAGTHNDGNTPSSGVAAGPDGGESSGSALPQTGNKGLSWVSGILGMLSLAGAAMLKWSSKVKSLFK